MLNALELIEGKHYGSKARAERFGVFGDSASYFAAARSAILNAQRQIILVGWDFHTEIELVRKEEPDDDAPSKIGDLLDYVLERNESLEVYILIWDFSMVYALERQWRAFTKSLRNPHPRLHFHYDKCLPTGASHHQKILVVDGEVGFAGGIDLSVWRWDTREHPVEEEARKDPRGESFAPYHDIHCVVTGEAQEVLRKICDSRWQRATGESLPEKGSSKPAEDHFPSGLIAETEEVDVLFACTYSAWEEHPDVWEIENFHLELIRSAERYLYFENQYFSSNRIGEAILDRIKDPDGPEVIIVLNNDTEGAMEEATMGKMRDYWFRKFHEEDPGGRVRTLHPVVRREGSETVRVYVHSKVVICDDRVLTIGSANLSNRSMRVDSELNMAIVEEETSPFVETVRNQLLAIHLGKDGDEFGKILKAESSLVRAIDRCASEEGRSLAAISWRKLGALSEELTREQILDPDEPIDPTYWVRSRVQGEDSRGIRRRVWMLSGLVALLLVLSLGFKYGWGNLVDENVVTGWVEAIQSAPYSPLILAGLFFLAGFLGFPLNAILVISSLILGPWVAFLSGYIGSHASAFASFGVGRRFGSRLLDKFDSEKVDRLNEKLSQQGILPVALLRIVPVAPFLVVNLVAGSSQLRQRSFHLGTILGMAPGMFIVSLFSSQVEKAVTDPAWEQFAILGGLIFLVLLVIGFIFRGVSRAGGSASGKKRTSDQGS